MDRLYKKYEDNLAFRLLVDFLKMFLVRHDITSVALAEAALLARYEVAKLKTDFKAFIPKEAIISLETYGISVMKNGTVIQPEEFFEFPEEDKK